MAGRCGGIGRHMAFKRPRPNGLVGSSPTIGNLMAIKTVYVTIQATVEVSDG